MGAIFYSFGLLNTHTAARVLQSTISPRSRFKDKVIRLFQWLPQRSRTVSRMYSSDYKFRILLKIKCSLSFIGSPHLSLPALITHIKTHRYSPTINQLWRSATPRWLCYLSGRWSFIHMWFFLFTSGLNSSFVPCEIGLLRIAGGLSSE